MAAYPGVVGSEVQVVTVSRPPRVSTRALSPRARRRSVRNISTKPQTRRSKLASGNGSALAVPRRHCTGSVLPAATASMPWFGSMPTTGPVGPTRRAAARARTGVPQPTSSTRSRGSVHTTCVWSSSQGASVWARPSGRKWAFAAYRCTHEWTGLRWDRWPLACARRGGVGVEVRGRMVQAVRVPWRRGWHGRIPSSWRRPCVSLNRARTRPVPAAVRGMARGERAGADAIGTSVPHPSGSTLVGAGGSAHGRVRGTNKNGESMMRPAAWAPWPQPVPGSVAAPLAPLGRGGS